MHDFITIDSGGGESSAMTFKYNEAVAVAAAAAASTTTSSTQSNYQQLHHHHHNHQNHNHHQNNQSSVTILNNASNRFEVNEKCDVFNVIPVHNYSNGENLIGSSNNKSIQQSTQVPRLPTTMTMTTTMTPATTTMSTNTTTTIECINSHGTITNFAAINLKSNENSWVCEIQNRSSDQAQKEHEKNQESTTVTSAVADVTAAAAATATATVYQNSDETNKNVSATSSDSSDDPKPERSEAIRPSYTSTEAQTDFDLIAEPSPSGQQQAQQQQHQSSDENRQRRRRERRERRNQRRFLNNFNIDPSLYDYRLLPDLLNINVPPPPYYSTLPLHQPTNGTHGPTTAAPNAFLMSTSGPNQTSAPIPMPIPVHLPSSSSTAASAAAAAAINTPTPQTTAAAVVVPNTIVPFHLPGEIHHQLLQNSSNGHLLQHPATAAAAAAAASATTFRFQFPPNIQFQRTRFGSRFSTEENQKSCCGLVLNKPSSIRYFIALIALTAVFCVLVGTILGVMRPAGRDHLTVSLLMIGVGVIMITVCGITWKLTSQSSACNSLFGLGSSTNANEPINRRFTNRLPPSYGRPHHPYAAMVYPEFMCRPPPPSYQASMQEYRLRLLLLERGCTNNAFFQPNLFNSQQINNSNNSNHNNNNNATPPPTYRSHNNSLLRNAISHTRGNSLQTNCSDIIIHSHHDPDNNTLNNTSAMVNVVNILSNQDEYCNSYKTAASENNHLVVDKINPLKLYLSSSANLNEIVLNQSDNDNEIKENSVNTTNTTITTTSTTTAMATTTTITTTTTNETVVAVPTHPNANNTNNNLVTIVQTNDQNPVIVTVSGPTEAIPTNFSSDYDDDEDVDDDENDEHQSNVLHVSNDMQILAHL